MKIIGGDRKIPMFGNDKEPRSTPRGSRAFCNSPLKKQAGEPLTQGRGPRHRHIYSFNSYTAAVAEAAYKTAP